LGAYLGIRTPHRQGFATTSRNQAGYEAGAIHPLIAHSPIFSWLDSILSVRTLADILGSLEIVAALLIANPAAGAGDLGHRQRDGDPALH
jgi:hypothetical protein